MLHRVNHACGLVTYQSPLLNSLGVRHAFSTRLGGASPPPAGDFDLADPDSDAGRTNYDRLGAAVGCPGFGLVAVGQPHGASVWRADGPTARPRPQADTIITTHPGLLLAIRTADCVPVLLSDAAGAAVAAVHAGWRSVVAGVAAQAVYALCDAGGSFPGQLTAAVGPCISVEHFEVGPEVAAAFADAGLGDVVVDHSPARPHVDLRDAVRRQLLAQGLAAECIEMTDRCTFAHGDAFYSHRRDAGRAGRHAAVIACKTPH